MIEQVPNKVAGESVCQIRHIMLLITLSVHHVGWDILGSNPTFGSNLKWEESDLRASAK